ncbi:pas domain s-box family protein [Stylonychia lemnae]|uniref:Pas domain s-box family protein n=1 Tax=Stylonychia lemnae TaxID=5949 RepID=A0A078AIC1_STYLE|nr:pas domain s-box family protein [Stylonychia lemnae]|eukprot:CDW81959.1 pas domain s-box family protein [Stylonychia lemnae]
MNQSAGNNSTLKRRNFFQEDENSVSRLVHFFKKRIFTANHLMIKAFHLHPFLLFLILIFEYLQFAYYALHKIQITDNFHSHSQQSGQTEDNLVTSQGKQALRNYEIALYSHLAIFIILIIWMLLVGSQRVMRAEEFHSEGKTNSNDLIASNFKNKDKSQNGHDSVQQLNTDRRTYMSAPYQHLLLGCVVFVVTNLFIMPTFFLYSTIINCDKLEQLGTYIENGVEYSDFVCLSKEHIIMISTASFLMMIALIFIVIESLLFQDLNMKSNLPWRQVPSRIHLFKILKKIVVSFYNFQIMTDKPIALGWKFERLFNSDRHSLKELGSDIAAEAYFGYLLDLIKTSQKNQNDKLILYGLLRIHWYSCNSVRENEQCLCNTLIQRIDRVERAIDEEFQSRNDQFDLMKIQKQIGQIEDEILKQEEQELQSLKNSHQVTKMSINIDHLMNELRKSEINKKKSNSNFLSPRSQDAKSLVIEDSMNNFDHDSQNMMNLLGEDANTLQYPNNQQAALNQKSNLIRVNEDEEDEIQVHLSKSELQKLKYLAAYIQYYLLKNEIKGLFEILIIERRNKLPIEWQFFLFKVKIEIEDYMDLVHKQRSSTTGRIDVKKVYLFARQLQDFEIGIETISDKCLDFWKELLKKSDFDANNLHKVGTDITLMNIQIHNLVQSMFNINPHHGYLLRIYAIFTQKVMNNDEDSEKYFTKFLNAQKTFQSYEASTLQEELVKNFSSNIKYAVIVMRVNTNETGIVEDVNHEIRNLLGYKRNEVIGRNIQVLMPKCVGNLHDQFVQNYLDTAKPKILNKQREVFALKKNGFLVQVFIYATSVPMIEKEGIKFVGFIKKVDEKKYTDILPPPIEYQFRKSIQIMAAPNGNIYGINEQAYKILGFPKYFTEDSDDKHSDYNVSQIIMDYNKVLFDCFKTAPSGRRAYLDTENLKPLIIPDMHSSNDVQHIKNCFGTYEVFIQACPLDFGYKGGAYLPMIIFRLYIIDRVKKETMLQITQSKRKQTSKKSILRRDPSRIESQKSPLMSRFYGSEHQSQKIGNFSHTMRPNEDIQFAIEEVENELSDDDVDANQINVNDHQQMPPNKSQEIQQFLESSQSSASFSNEGKSTDLARLREFRKMVNSRKEPQTVIFLRRFVIFVTAIILAIESVNTAFKINFYKSISELTTASITLSDITIQLYQIHSSMRMLINIDNQIIRDGIYGLIDDGQYQIQLTNNLIEYINGLNDNKNRFLDKHLSYLDEIQEYTNDLQLKTLFNDGTSEFQKVNLNLALGQVISKGNNLIQLQRKNPEAFKNRTFISYINKVSKNNTKNKNETYNFTYGELGNEIDQTTKDLYYIHENIFNVLIEKCEQITDNIQNLKDDYTDKSQISFLVMISSILILSMISISLIFYFVRQIHKTRIQSLSLYAELNIDDIQMIITDLSIFMKIIKNSSDDLSKKINQNPNITSEEECEEVAFQDNYEYDENEQLGTNQIQTIKQISLKKKKKLILDGLSNSFHEIRKLQKHGLSDLHIQAKFQETINSSDFDSFHLNHMLSNTVVNNKPQGNTNNNIINDQPIIRFEHARSIEMTVSRQSSFVQESASLELVESSMVEINEIDLSSRELNPQEIKRNKQTKNTKDKKLTPQQIEQQKKLEEEEKKVGNLDKFKMVKSNSGIRVISIVLCLFSFVIILVIANFAIYVPMYKDFKKSHRQELVLLTQFRAYYKIYMQFMHDLTNGSIQRSIPETYQSNFNFYQQKKFDVQQEINRIIHTHDQSSYITAPIQLQSAIYTSDYCDKIQEYYSILNANFNLTYCLTVDNQIAQKQGFQIQIDRMMGELTKMRLVMEDRIIDYDRYILLFDKEQILSKLQYMINNLFTPTFYALKYLVKDSFDEYIKLNMNIDISLLSVFVGAQLLILLIAWPKFLRNMNNQISKSRGILTLIPSRLIITNNNIKKIIEQNKLLTQ